MPQKDEGLRDIRRAFVGRSRVGNRLGAVMIHIPWYSIRGISRLAFDAKVSRSAVCRIVHGQPVRSYAIVVGITRAIEMRLHRHLDPRELFTIDGTYLTPSTCRLLDCPGCLPDAVYNDDGTVRHEYRHIKAGEWKLPLPTEISA